MEAAFDNGWGRLFVVDRANGEVQIVMTLPMANIDEGEDLFRHLRQALAPHVEFLPGDPPVPSLLPIESLHVRPLATAEGAGSAFVTPRVRAVLDERRASKHEDWREVTET